jgi:hypothetical protein
MLSGPSIGHLPMALMMLASEGGRDGDSSLDVAAAAAAAGIDVILLSVAAGDEFFVFCKRKVSLVCPPPRVDRNEV